MFFFGKTLFCHNFWCTLKSCCTTLVLSFAHLSNVETQVTGPVEAMKEKEITPGRGRPSITIKNLAWLKALWRKTYLLDEFSNTHHDLGPVEDAIC